MLTRVELPANSAYAQTPVYASKAGPVFGLRLRQLSPANDDQQFVIPATRANRLDLVSNDFYGTPDYWWAIADASSLVDAQSVPAGTTLRIPSKRRIPT
jgi:hypothetical protein